MKKLCRICLKPCDKNLQKIDRVTFEMMNILLLKPNVDITADPVLCCECTGILQKCFSFKSACFYTEEFLFPFINLEYDPDGKLDLKELYVKTQSLEDLNIPSCEKMCRLCMELVSDGLLTPLCDVDLVMIQKCLPEVNLMLTKEPVICDTCHNFLKSYMSFMDTCVQTEEKINRYRQIKGVNKRGKVALTKVPGFSEEGQCDEEIANNLQISMVPDIKSKKKRSSQYHSLHMDSLIHTDLSHLEWHHCDICMFKTTQKDRLTRHIATHYKEPKITLKKCPLCNYQAKYFSMVKNHMTIHEDPSNVKMYSCEYCSFKTRFKHSLKNHMRKHMKTYKYHCEVCPFQTKYIESFKRHSVLHKDAKELQFLHCAKCEFKTLRKPRLVVHIMRTHMDPSKALTYYCVECTYTSVCKTDYMKHALIHKRRSFKSKHNMRKHVLQEKACDSKRNKADLNVKH